MPAPQNNSFGIDYNPGRVNKPHNPGSMLNRVQESLNSTIQEPGALQGEGDYSYKPVAELTDMFKPQRPKPTYRKCYLPCFTRMLIIATLYLW